MTSAFTVWLAVVLAICAAPLLGQNLAVPLIPRPRPAKVWTNDDFAPKPAQANVAVATPAISPEAADLQKRLDQKIDALARVEEKIAEAQRDSATAIAEKKEVLRLQLAALHKERDQVRSEALDLLSKLAELRRAK